MPTTRVRVSINFSADEWERACDFFRAVGRPDLAHAPRNRFGYTLDVGGEAELAQFKAVAEVFGFTKDIGLVGRENHYSSREMAAAAFVSVRYTRRARGVGGPESGTQYDFEAGCPCCGSGARQISELSVKGKLPEQPGLIQIETGEWLLSEQIADPLGDHLNGVDLLPVRAKRGSGVLPWVQLVPQVSLPPFAPTTRGVTTERQCACCSRNGYFGSVSEPFELHYGTQVCTYVYDAMWTWEHFGLSSLRTPRSETVLAKPVLIISAELFRAIRAQNLRGLAFIPVTCDYALPSARRNA